MTRSLKHLPLSALAAALLVAGCAQQTASTGGQALADGDMCVEIPDGYYSYSGGPDQFTPVTFVEGATYRVQDGNLVLVGADASAPAPAPVISGSALASRIAEGFPALGFPWMGLNINGAVATLTGTAPTLEAKNAAFAAGEGAIRADADAGMISLIVDGISVEGGERGVGEAVAGLGANPDLTACQNAFTDTMSGRNIEFEVNRATINPVSARLLDALSGVATICSAGGQVEIEIGGHTDTRGSTASNQRLSQTRADSVRGYLISKGVDGDALIAVGYGESQPLDTSVTEEAHARNRRTEFIIRPRQ